jgi:ABC-type nitrate/sulfonate/bicarbonate transport system substrate-binding protein
MLLRNTVAAFVIFAATACAGTAPTQAQSTDVRFVLDFLLQGQQSAFVLGRERGYYAAQKFDRLRSRPRRRGLHH